MKIFGLTGPSKFTRECISMIEEFFQANCVYLNQNKFENIEYHLRKCQAVVLGGGVDIHPSLYSYSMDDEISASALTKANFSDFDIERDIKELRILKYCFTHNKPVLGICRGHQMIGIYHHIKFLVDLTDSDIAHQPSKFGINAYQNQPTHQIKIIDENYIIPEAEERKIIKNLLDEKTSNRILVNSFHHQALAYDKNENYSEKNITVQGIAYAGLKNCTHIIEIMRGKGFMSAQFHPEWDWEHNTYSRDFLTKFKEEFLR